MDLTKIENIKSILKEEAPLKKLGQNFLIDKETITTLIKTVDIQSTDNVLEIGPGLGALTKELTKKAKQVTVVEKDSRMIKHLKSLNKENLTIINDDFLKLPTKIYNNKDYKVVANLPFNIATAIIRKLLKESPPTLISVIVQEEVAKRIVSKGEKENFLSIITKFRGDPQFIKKISKNYFWPSPKVNGAILKITPHLKYTRNENFSKLFFKVVESGFRHPRKQLKNNLADLENFSKPKVKEILTSINIDPKKRAEDLSLNHWIKISKKYLTFNEKESKIKQA
ncbi:MAG: 16S rRNA (adenine(1518)-N(6)/adenine(1519)-N(6))-dimethyltransferase RsmA [Patescibacteria group bacterium]